jgi:hypothetical protein
MALYSLFISTIDQFFGCEGALFSKNLAGILKGLEL